MACIVCDSKLDHGVHCVMGSWTAQLTVGWVANVIQKVFFLQKESRSAIRLSQGSRPAKFYTTCTLNFHYITL